MLKNKKPFTLTQVAFALVFSAIIIRLITLGLFPLMDTTEARYGEMARIMAETGNWITPMFDYQVPFWGKPPLFTWLSAGGIKALGVTEFAVRLPHLITGCIILFLVWLQAYNTNNRQPEPTRKQEAWLAVGILATTATFIVVTGAVMTDTALTLGITLSMVAFWFSYKHQSKLWGHLFFIGLTIGMLAKGPLALVLVGMSLFLWTLYNKGWGRLATCLPWKTGIPLFIITTLPWYVLAENASPGFLNYFIVGEHIKRFLISGWQGDLYGTAHKEIKGTIWLFAIVSALPWTPIFIYQWLKGFKRTNEQTRSVNGPESEEDHTDLSFISLLWCWLLAPLILFTFSGNILSSYVMPSLPAFALLLVNYQRQNPLPVKVYKTGFIMPVLILLVALLLRAELTGKQSDKGLMLTWQQQAQNNELVYINKRPFSAQFYSAGKATESKLDVEVAVAAIKQDTFFVLRNSSDNKMVVNSLPQCAINQESKKRMLVFCHA